MTTLKNKKGITLIALVITIIVILILAGVSIMSITGENGVLNKAVHAKEKMQEAENRERVELAILGSYDENGKLDLETLKENLRNITGATVEDTNTFPAIATIGDIEYTIDSEGNITETEADSNIIIQDLKIVTNSNGTGESAGTNQPAGTKLYISFKATAKEGSISSVKLNGEEVTKVGDLYVQEITQGGRYTFQIKDSNNTTTSYGVTVSNYASSSGSGSGSGSGSVTKTTKQQIQEAIANNKTGDTIADADALISDLQSITGVTSATKKSESETYPITVNANGAIYEISQDGTITNKTTPTVGTVSITQTNGTAIPEEGVEAGTALKITYPLSIADGTIESVTPGTYSNGNVTYTTSGTEEEVEFTISYKVDGQAKTATTTVELENCYAQTGKTIAEVYDATGTNENGLHIGDFVNYTAGTWDETKLAKITASGAKVAPNKSTSLPSSNYQFGGFAATASLDGNATPRESSCAYVTDKSTGQAITGWRIFDIDTTNNTMEIISAGCPEDYYHPVVTNGGYISQYILTGDESCKTYAPSTYTARDWSMYVNSTYGATTATALSKTRLDTWYSKYIVANANTYTASTFRKIYDDSKYTKYQSLIDNYSVCHLATRHPDNSFYLSCKSPSNNYVAWGCLANGVRVLVSLSEVKLTEEPTGSKTVTSRGTDYIYNVWGLN